MLDRAIAADPKDVVSLGTKASALWEMRRFTEALGALEEVRKLEPDSELAFRLRGFCLWRLGRPKEALPSLESALEAKPTEADTWKAKGMVLLQLGRRQEALAAMKRTADLAPHDKLAVRAVRELSVPLDPNMKLDVRTGAERSPGRGAGGPQASVRPFVELACPFCQHRYDAHLETCPACQRSLPVELLAVLLRDLSELEEKAALEALRLKESLELGGAP